MIINYDYLDRTSSFLCDQTGQTFPQVIGPVKRSHDNGNMDVCERAPLLIVAPVHFRPLFMDPLVDFESALQLFASIRYD